MQTNAKIFVERYLKSPRTVGSLIPSSVGLARAFGYISHNFSETEMIVEFGAGTGSATQFLPARTVSVELDPKFHLLLQDRFPERDIVLMDAIDYLHSLAQPVSIVSSIPLINNPSGERFKETVKRFYKDGMINNFVTFSYGRRSPFGNCGFENEHKVTTIYRNIPPANIWHYW